MTKGSLLQEIWDSLPEERQQRIKERMRKLETEYLTLQELKQATRSTPAHISQQQER